jgi:hypothetical protein
MIITGSVGCAMFEIYKDDELKKVTVFNLPNSAFLARKAIAAKGLKYDVSVHEGDFLIDELPTGFDRILYSRVLCDWSPEVCLMQFQKANRALLPGGKLIINEGLSFIFITDIFLYPHACLAGQYEIK